LTTLRMIDSRLRNPASTRLATLVGDRHLLREDTGVTGLEGSDFE
jgi:hypothetical protein